MEHQDPYVRAALIHLNDILCEYERNTGIQSVLTLREQGGFTYRSVSGKPLRDNTTPDFVIFQSIIEGYEAMPDNIVKK